MFCPKCGSILLPKSSGLECGCGYRAKGGSVRLTEASKSKQDAVAVEEGTHDLPLTDMLCPKCEHAKAFYWELQTRAGDEAATRFFKCEKCGHSWREK